MDQRAIPVLLAVAFAAQNLVGASWHGVPDALSEGLHLEYVQAAKAALRDGDFAGITYQGFPYGPLVFVAAAVVELVTGLGLLADRLTQQGFALIALVCTALLAGRDPRARLWAAGCLAAAPMFLHATRHVTTDAALCAAVAAGALALQRSRGLATAAAPFGLALGLGLLAKISVLHLLVGLVVLVPSRWPGDWASRLKNAAIAGGIAALVAVPYYRHFVGEAVQRRVDQHGFGPSEAWGVVPPVAYPRFGGETWLDWLLFHPRVAVHWQLGLLLTAVLVAGIVAGRRDRDVRWLAGGAAIAGLVFTAMAMKKWYYALPLLPLLCAAAGPGLARLAERTPARVALIAAVVGTFLGAGWGGVLPGWNPEDLLRVAPAARVGDPTDAEVRALVEPLRGPMNFGPLLWINEQPMKRASTPGHRCVFGLTHRIERELAASGSGLDFGGADSLELIDGVLNRNPPYVLWVGPPDAGWLTEMSRSLGPPPHDPVRKRRVLRLADRLEPVAQTRCAPWFITLYRVRPDAS